jgi:hypothetical protein
MYVAVTQLLGTEARGDSMCARSSWKHTCVCALDGHTKMFSDREGIVLSVHCPQWVRVLSSGSRGVGQRNPAKGLGAAKV